MQGEERHFADRRDDDEQRGGAPKETQTDGRSGIELVRGQDLGQPVTEAAKPVLKEIVVAIGLVVEPLWLPQPAKRPEESPGTDTAEQGRRRAGPDACGFLPPPRERQCEQRQCRGPIARRRAPLTPPDLVGAND